MDKYYCACCGYKTLDYPEDVCEICHWQGDGVQDRNPDGAPGPNKVTLKEAQRNFQEFGAADRRFIDKARKPTRNDEKNPDWKLF